MNSKLTVDLQTTMKTYGLPPSIKAVIGSKTYRQAGILEVLDPLDSSKSKTLVYVAVEGQLHVWDLY